MILHPYLNEKIPIGLLPYVQSMLLARFLRGDLDMVGELWDETTEENKDFKKISDDLYHINASIDLVEFCEYFEIDIESEMVSFSGWITDQLEKIPTTGDHFDYEGMAIRVLSTDSHRVSEVEVRLTEDYKKSAEDEKETAAIG